MASKTSATPQTHGGSVLVPVESLLANDPELALARADMAAYHEAHPCRCEPDCACDEECDCPCH